MSWKTISTSIAAATLLAACGDTGTDSPDPAQTTDPAGEVVSSDLTRETDPQVEPADVTTQVDGNNQFAIDLYQASLDGSQDDLIASPYSVSLALAMTYAGARGDTATEMADVMHYRLAQEELHPVFNYLDLTLESRGANASGQEDGDPFRLEIANAIWGQTDYEFKQEFLDTIALNYGAGLRLLDFQEEPEASRLTINEWVETKTEEKIKNLLPEGSITPATVMVLTNAIYFNAAWETPFQEGLTSDADFTTLSGNVKQVPMMSQMERHGHARVGSADAVELDYDGGEVSMVLIVPDEFQEFEENEFDADYLRELDESMEPKMVDLAMPKFQIDTTLPLTETLQEMGMILPFTDADLSGLADGDLVITDVIHKAFINLNEEGTEAAAATAVVVGETSAPTAEVTVNANKPFIYLIRDVETGTVLFIGRVADPS